jgi:hypothetical protein
MDNVKARTAFMNRFGYATKKRNAAAVDGDAEDVAYWQGQKDATRLLMVELELSQSQGWAAIAENNEEVFSSFESEAANE